MFPYSERMRPIENGLIQSHFKEETAKNITFEISLLILDVTNDAFNKPSLKKVYTCRQLSLKPEESDHFGFLPLLDFHDWKILKVIPTD